VAQTFRPIRPSGFDLQQPSTDTVRGEFLDQRIPTHLTPLHLDALHLASVNEVDALDRQIGDAVALDREQLIPCVAAPLTFKRPLAASADTRLTTSASQSSPKWHLFLPAFELACLALGQLFSSSKASDLWLINIQRQYSWLALPCPHGRWPKSHRQTIQRQMPVWEKR
jgi:hypothetical protein